MLPINIPNTICFIIIGTIEPTPVLDMKVKTISVNIYAIGSLLPLSISNKGANEPFKLSFWERSIENTEAASVEPTTDPIRNPSNKLVPNTK